MGSVTHSILSGTSGRTGRVVIASVPGVEISRARPATRGSSTSLQNAQRKLFSFAVAFLGWYKSFAHLFFGKRKGLVTPYNQAQANVLQNIPLTGRDVIINYKQVVISKGNLLEMVPACLGIFPAWVFNTGDYFMFQDRKILKAHPRIKAWNGMFDPGTPGAAGSFLLKTIPALFYLLAR